VLVLPVVQAVATGRAPALPDARAYRRLALLVGVLHVAATAMAMRDVLIRGSTVDLQALPKLLLAATTRNVCQASISIDAVLASLAGIAFMVGSADRQHRTHALACSLAGAVVGPAAGLAWYCARREETLTHDEQRKQQ